MNSEPVLLHEHVSRLVADGLLGRHSVPVAGADHEVNAVVINLAREHVTTMQDEFHFGQVLGVSPELVGIQPFPIVPFIFHFSRTSMLLMQIEICPLVLRAPEPHVRTSLWPSRKGQELEVDCMSPNKILCLS